MLFATILGKTFFSARNLEKQVSDLLLLEVPERTKGILEHCSGIIFARLS